MHSDNGNEGLNVVTENSRHQLDITRELDNVLDSELVRYYTWFHIHPELSYHEVGTTARIRKILESKNVEILDTGLNTGLIAVIRGEESGPVIALRGDIDGLPIQEQTGLEYASQNAGVMHACGHDFNLSVALGAAILLNAHRDIISGTIKVIFQPAEEGRATKDQPTGGVQVIETGVLDDVQAFFGTHDGSRASRFDPLARGKHHWRC
jgi:amidohydrolase